MLWYLRSRGQCRGCNGDDIDQWVASLNRHGITRVVCLLSSHDLVSSHHIVFHQHHANRGRPSLMSSAFEFRHTSMVQQISYLVYQPICLLLLQ
jgi:hypothetical protein